MDVKTRGVKPGSQRRDARWILSGNREILRLAAAVVLACPFQSNPASEGSPGSFAGLPSAPAGLSPGALAISPEGGRLFIACAAAQQVAVLDTTSGEVTRWLGMPEPPLGLAITRDGGRLYVACAAPRSIIGIVDVAQGRLDGTMAAGHTAMAPVLSPDERTLYVCNRFDDDVSVIDLEAGVEVDRVPVRRQPVAAGVTPDGGLLLVANHLPAGHANAASAAAAVSVIDTTLRTVIREIVLPGGSGLVRGLSVSPDGGYAAVSHILGHFHWVPRMVHLGWINQNAVSLIDLRSLSLLSTVTLDEESRGAANPWALAWTAGGQSLCITHAGTHELSVLAAPALLEKVKGLPERLAASSPTRNPEFEYYRLPRYGPARARVEAPTDFEFLRGIRTRVPLRGVGPRAIAVAGQRAYVAHYFSDSVDVVDLASPAFPVTTIPLSPAVTASAARQGERWFNEATLCAEGWQSCASCHDADARQDGLNWDLLNDGAHNPKNTRSLLLSPVTPPVMSLQVRDSAHTAVRAGLHHILFAQPPPEVPAVIDAYLESLLSVPSPRLIHGQFSAAAERGEHLFRRRDVGCAGCHPAPLFTDLAAHDVGTANDYDRVCDRFDTPTLVELWRTAPYLHDGSAATVRDVLTARNPEDRHGCTSRLTAEEIEDLVEYVLSL